MLTTRLAFLIITLIIGLVLNAQESIFYGADNIDRLLPSVGFGYRLEVQPRKNLRIDFGFGRNTQGVYFDFNEAF